ncbi:MAG: PRD domain-containing protein [Clostridiales Family XIII bacterium]|nr:PRD domain-containing protein [Clostridiales Family XIII bacterium]
MSSVESKVKKIAIALLASDGFLTLDYLAGKCDTTGRSVQNHIKKLEELIAENGYADVKILKKPGRGIKMAADEQSRDGLIRLFSSQDTFEADHMKRRVKELNLLLFSNSELTIGFLADYFYTSRSVILKDMEWIDGWLKAFNLQLFKIQRMGIRIAGEESAKRNAIATFFDMYRPNRQFAADKPGGTTSPSRRLQEQLVAKLKTLYPNIDIVPIVTLLEDAEKKYDFYLTEEYFTTLVTHLVICVSRVKGGNETEECVLKEDEYASVLETARFIGARIEQAYGIRFPSEEIAYICLHLMGYAMRNSVVCADSDDTSGNFGPLAMAIIEHVQNRHGGRFTTDKLLYFGLLYHLQAAVYRIKNGIHINHIDTGSMPVPDKALMDALHDVEKLYKSFCGQGINLPPEELENLAIHFKLSQGRIKRPRRAVLLCESGAINGVILKNQILESADNNIEFVDIMNVPFQLDLLRDDEYDFIITTTEFSHRSKPVAHLKYEERSAYGKFLSNFIKTHVAN